MAVQARQPSPGAGNVGESVEESSKESASESEMEEEEEEEEWVLFVFLVWLAFVAELVVYRFMFLSCT